MEYPYFKGLEADRYSFYRVPKALVKADLFQKMSGDAKSLQKSGAQITNIVVTDNNIKSFDRVARKYGIDYSLKKVEQDGKTEYMVFFKAKDVDVMTAAFKEYTSETLKKQKRESVRQKLEKVKEELSNHRQLKKEKKREQEPIR